MSAIRNVGTDPVPQRDAADDEAWGAVVKPDGTIDTYTSSLGSTYLACPQRAGFRLLGVRIPPPSFFAFGNALQEPPLGRDGILDRKRLGKPLPSWRDIRDRFHAKLDEEASLVEDWDRGDTKDKQARDGERLLELYVERVVPYINPHPDYPPETGIVVQLSNGIKVRGYPDVIERTHRGVAGARDLKTARSRWQRGRELERIQHLDYSFLLSAVTGEAPETFAYDICARTAKRDPIEVRSVPIPPEALIERPKAISAIVQSINADLKRGYFLPRPGWQCGYCGYRDLCQQTHKIDLPKRAEGDA